MGRWLAAAAAAWLAVSMPIAASPPLSEQERQDLLQAQQQVQAATEEMSRHGDARKALKLLYDAYMTQAKLLEPNDPVLADTLTTLSQLNWSVGNHTFAEKFARQAYETLLNNPQTDPVAVAKAGIRLASALDALNRSGDALPLIQDGLRILEQNLQPGSPDIIQCRGMLADTLRMLGRKQEALPHAKRATDEASQRFGPADPTTSSLALQQAWLLIELNRVDEAAALAEPIYARIKNGHQPDRPGTEALAALASRVMAAIDLIRENWAGAETKARDAIAPSLDKGEPFNALYALNIALAASNHLGHSEQSIALSKEVYETIKTNFGPANTVTDRALLIYLSALNAAGRSTLSVAEPAYNDVRKVLGPKHIRTLALQVFYASSLTVAGRLEEAEQQAKEAYEGIKQSLGPADPQTVDAAHAYAYALNCRHHDKPLLALTQETYDAVRRRYGPQSPFTLQAELRLAQANMRNDRIDEAERLAREAYEGLKATAGNRDIATIRALSQLANILSVYGGPDVEAMARQAYEGIEEALGPDSRNTILALSALVRAMQVNNRTLAALPYARQAYERALRALPASDFDSLNIQMIYVAQLADLGQFAEAEKVGRALYDNALKSLGPNDPITYRVLSFLARLRGDQGDVAGAEAMAKQVYAAMKTQKGAADPDTVRALQTLTWINAGQQPPDDTERMARQVADNFADILGADSIEALNARLQLAGFLSQQKKNDQAEAIAREVYGIANSKYGIRVPVTVLALGMVSWFDGENGQPKKQLESLETLLNVTRQRGGDNYMPTIGYLAMIGNVRAFGLNDYERGYVEAKQAATSLWLFVGDNTQRLNAPDSAAMTVYMDITRRSLSSGRFVFENQIDIGWTLAHPGEAGEHK